MKTTFLLIFTALMISCGGGGGISDQDPVPPTIIGLQGDINAIEPIDLDQS